MLILCCLFPSPVPGSPQNVLAYSTTSVSIYLSWDPPPDDQRNGMIVHYTVRVVQPHGEATVYMNSTATSIVVTSLTPYQSVGRRSM